MKTIRRIVPIGSALMLIAGLVIPGIKLKSQSTSVTLVGASDISDAFPLNLTNSMATAALLDSMPSATVFIDGDSLDTLGSEEGFALNYDLTWGRARSRTIPVIGHHDYDTINGGGYFNYFGTAAGDPTKGYYSINLGAWHIVALSSVCDHVPGGCSAGSPQETWLRSDLASNTNTCILALWHQPLFTSSAQVTPNTDMQQMWADLYSAHATLVVNGHAHNYERFAPQDALGNMDTAQGIIEIVVGTGGAQLFPFNATLAPNSLVQNSTTWGVLQLTLNSTSVSWQFIPIAGQTFTDSGSQACR